MKTLYIIRHAKSSWDDPTLSDFDRPLNKRGMHDAPAMGKRLNKRNVIPDLMLSSPAERALSTCKLIAEVVGYSLNRIKMEQSLYHAEDAEILRIVQSINPKYDSVWIFGHNPGFTEFANALTNEGIDNIPTCGVVACSLSIDSWDDVAWGNGTLLFFDFPKKKS